MFNCSGFAIFKVSLLLQNPDLSEYSLVIFQNFDKVLTPSKYLSMHGG